jgi:hypothetical protein
MALDPSISLGYRGIEIPNQLAQYGQMAQLESAQNQSQVAQMQIAQMRRDEATLRQIQAKAVEHGGPADLNQIADAYLKSGNPKFVEFGIGLRQKLDERDQVAKIMGMGQPPAAAPAAAPVANALTAPMQAGALGSGTFGMAPEPVANRLAAPAAAPMAAPAAAAPAAAPTAAPGGLNLETLLAQRKAFIALKMPDMARALDAEIALASKEPVYHNVTGVGLVDPRTARVVVPSVEAKDPLVKQYEYAQAQGFSGSLFDYKRKLAEAGRTPPQPVAPTITQIVDPSDPNKMITIDARRYQGGGAGSPGVIGVSGKEPSAALRENKAEAGKTQLQNIIEDVRAHYDQLNQAGDIPSTQRGALSNIASSTQSSALGQFGGRVIGTESQRARENIKSSRLMLLNALKQATGKSAQELNSNVELKTNLDALSDPTQGYEAAIDILNKLEDVYVRGVAPAKARAAAPSPAPAATKSGASVSNW